MDYQSISNEELEKMEKQYVNWENASFTEKMGAPKI